MANQWSELTLKIQELDQPLGAWATNLIPNKTLIKDVFKIQDFELRRTHFLKLLRELTQNVWDSYTVLSSTCGFKVTGYSRFKWTRHNKKPYRVTKCCLRLIMYVSEWLTEVYIEQWYAALKGGTKRDDYKDLNRVRCRIARAMIEMDMSRTGLSEKLRILFRDAEKAKKCPYFGHDDLLYVMWKPFTSADLLYIGETSQGANRCVEHLETYHGDGRACDSKKYEKFRELGGIQKWIWIPIARSRTTKTGRLADEFDAISVLNPGLNSSGTGFITAAPGARQVNSFIRNYAPLMRKRHRRSRKGFRGISDTTRKRLNIFTFPSDGKLSHDLRGREALLNRKTALKKMKCIICLTRRQGKMSVAAVESARKRYKSLGKRHMVSMIALAKSSRDDREFGKFLVNFTKAFGSFKDFIIMSKIKIEIPAIAATRRDFERALKADLHAASKLTGKPFLVAVEYKEKMGPNIRESMINEKAMSKKAHAPTQCPCHNFPHLRKN